MTKTNTMTKTKTKTKTKTSNEELHEQIEHLLHQLADAQTRTEEAESRLMEIENLKVGDYVNIANALRNMESRYDYDVRRCHHYTKRNLDLVGKLENAEYISEKIRDKKRRERKETRKETKMVRFHELKEKLRKTVKKRSEFKKNSMS